MINKVFIGGHVGQDPKTNANKTASNFSVAVNRKSKSATGETTQETLWVNVVAYKKQAEFADQYLQAGDKVLVEGALREREYEGKNGTVKVTELVASNFTFLGRKGDSSDAS